MKRDFGMAPRVAIFLAGVAAGALSGLTDKRRREADSGAIQDLKRSIAELEARLVAQQSASTAKFGQVETQLQEHTAKLAEMPSTKQIVDAMEQLLSRTMSSLDERLTTQAHSIDAPENDGFADGQPFGAGAGVARQLAKLRRDSGTGRDHAGEAPGCLNLPIFHLISAGSPQSSLICFVLKRAILGKRAWTSPKCCNSCVRISRISIPR